MEVALIVHPLLAPTQPCRTQALARRTELAVQAELSSAPQFGPAASHESGFYLDLSRV